MENIECLSLSYKDGELKLLDQQLLPHDEHYVVIHSIDDMVSSIKQLKVRGAPAIGVAAALALAQFAQSKPSLDALKKAAQDLYEARPTAVNLMLAMDRLILKADPAKINHEFIVNEAFKIFHEDVELCQKMAVNGAELIQDGDQILTHCNTGGLATAGVGTALGVIRQAWQQGKKIHVWVDETRPLLQGGRLTAWECEKLGIPHTVICDNMAAMLMKQGKVDKIFLGSDRVAGNGDFANKIGTYNLAVLAKHHNVEFYPVAPYTTIDPDCPNGDQIPIELRADFEVKGVQGSFGDVQWSPKNSPAYNPAFDVTPSELVTAFVFDHGVFSSTQLQAGEHLKK